MENQNDYNAEEIFSKALELEEELIFDVRETKAGDYYLTITESKSLLMKMELFYKKHKFIFTKRTFLSLILLLKRLVTLSLKIKVKRL